jgi:hypothetical protein
MLSIRCLSNTRGNGVKLQGTIYLPVQTATRHTIGVVADIPMQCWNDMKIELTDDLSWDSSQATFPISYDATINYIAPKQSKKDMAEYFVVSAPTTADPRFQISVKDDLSSRQKLLLCPGILIKLSIPSAWTGIIAPTPFEIIIHSTGLKVDLNLKNSATSLPFVARIVVYSSNQKIKFHTLGSTSALVKDVQLITSNAKITGKSLYASSLLLSTSNADIEVEEGSIIGDATIKTSNSDIELDLFISPARKRPWTSALPTHILRLTASRSTRTSHSPSASNPPTLQSS